MTTTLNQIRKKSPCQSGWKKLLAHLGKKASDDKPLSIVTILESNGLDDALWCLKTVKGHDREIRLYAVWCARQVQHLMTDPRSLAALDVAERFANGCASDSERDAAWAAAGDAAVDAARAASWVAAARDASWAAAARDVAAARDASLVAALVAAGNAALVAAGDAAGDAARAASWAAAWAAAWDDAAGDAARAAAWAAARAAQENRLREICIEIETGEHHV